MNSRIIMTSSSIFLGLMGLSFTFLPEELVNFLSDTQNQSSILFVQILGSMYFGFAMLNWMTRKSPIGGIYGRPLVIGNLVHFMVSSIALIKAMGQYDENGFMIVLTLTAAYVLFSVLFGYLMMNNPSQVK
ncbi:MAG: hypothetical protein AAGC47_14175 [Bacteroidota bacterium]